MIEAHVREVKTKGGKLRFVAELTTMGNVFVGQRRKSRKSALADAARMEDGDVRGCDARPRT